MVNSDEEKNSYFKKTIGKRFSFSKCVYRLLSYFILKFNGLGEGSWVSNGAKMVNSGEKKGAYL